MNRSRTMIYALTLALSLASASLFGQEAPAASGAPIEMTAKKYEFNPSTIKVKQGDHVKLVITATDRDHGFRIKEFDVNQRLPKGVPTTVEFTASRAGTFPFHCSVVCGLGHGRMKGQLIVEPAAGGAAPTQ